MTDSTDELRLGRLLDEFLAKLRDGKSPSVEDYVREHPDLANEIEDIFPALLAVQEVEPGEDTSEVPRRLGDYEILREIGRGGMGIVYETVQRSLGRRVALKVLPHVVTLDKDRLERFRSEARAAGKLHHTNIVPVFSVGESEGTFYYAMQYIEGVGLDVLIRQMRDERQSQATDRRASTNEELRDRTVAEAIARAGPARHASRPNESTTSSQDLGTPARSSSLSSSDAGYFRRVARIGLQAAEAMEYAHRRGIVHRDIKPANILLDAQNNVWITDFGLAKVEDSTLTRTGDIVGTLQYMAPERFEGTDDLRVDIYALGLTLYELATLRPAFEAETQADLIAKLVNESPRRPRSHHAAIPRDLETIILKAIARDPDHRYSSARSMADDLRAFLELRPIGAKRASLTRQLVSLCRRHPIPTGMSAIIGLLIVSIAIVSTIASFRLQESNQRAWDNLGRAWDAEAKETEARIEATRRLFDSQVSTARALRTSPHQGRREQAFEALGSAVRLAGELNLGPQAIVQLRQLAVDCGQLSELIVDVNRKDSGSVPPSPIPRWGFSADLDFVARCDSDGNVEIIRLDSGEVVQTLEGFWGSRGPYQRPLTRFGGRDRLLAIRGLWHGDELRVQLWNWRERELVLDKPVGGVVHQESLAFSPDGRRLALVTDTSSISVLDTSDGREVVEVPAPFAPAWIEFAPDGDSLFAESTQGIRQLRLEDGMELGVIYHESSAHDMSISASKPLAATAGANGNIYVWDMRSFGAAPRVFVGHSAQVTRVSIHPTGRYLASSSMDGTTRIWRISDGQTLLVANYGAFEFSRDGDYLGFEIAGREFGRWRFVQGSAPLEIALSDVRTDDVVDLDFSPDLVHLVGACLHQGLFVCRVEDGEVLQSFGAYGSNARVEFLSDHCLMTSGAISVDLWKRRPKAKTPGSQVVHQQRVLSVSAGTVCAALLDEKQVVAALGEQRLWKRNRVGRVGSANLGRYIDRVEVHPKGWILGTSDQHADLLVIDAETLKIIREVHTPSQSGTRSALSTNGALAAITMPGKLVVYETENWKVVHEAEFENQSVGQATFARDGSLLAVTGFEQVWLFDTRGFRLIAQLHDARRRPLAGLHSAEACGLTFSDDGALLAVGTQNSTIQIWDLRQLKKPVASLGLPW